MSFYRLFLDRNDPRLGRNVFHDSRSRGFDLARAVKPKLPDHAIRWERRGPVFDQGDLGCCTACAALGLMMTEPFATSGSWSMDQVRAFYHDETVLDNFAGSWPPDDTGSNGLAAMKVLKRRGAILGYHHAFSPVVAVAALTKGPIAVGTVWLHSMFNPRRGQIIVDQRSSVDGGHEYVVDGWDPKTRRVHMTNSWGDWGVEGGAEIAYADFAWLLGQRGDAVQPTDVAQVLPTAA